MLNFTQFLLEVTLSHDEALKILGLRAGSSADDVKTAYRELSRQHHPDVGGSTVTMQRINAAYAVLKSGSGPVSNVPSPRTSYDDMVSRARAYAEIAKSTTEGHIHPSRYQAHFEQVFGEPFTVVDSWHPYRNGMHVWYTGEYANADRTIVLSMSVTVDFTAFYDAPVLSAPDASLSMSIVTSILYNRKSVKLTQSVYRVERTHNVLESPEVLFPAAKLKSQTTKSGTRKLSKRDVLLTFQKELGSTLDNQYVWVPIGSWKLGLWRMTIRGAAGWSIVGVYEKHRKVADTKNHMFMETDEVMNFLYKELRTLQKDPPDTAQELVTAINHFIDYHKSGWDALK